MAQPSNKKKINYVHKTTRELFYATPIFYKDLVNAKELNKHLWKHIKSWKKRDEKGINRSNSLGWHSAVDMHHRIEYAPLIKELFQMQEEIYKAEGYHPDTEPVCDNMWANVNYKYSHNKNHVHPGAQWSGVYYIKTPPKCGHIWFTDPCGQRHIDMPIMEDKIRKPVHYWREVHYEPIEGRLIMFPGWLVHEVAPNMSDLTGEKGWRVSVSFNFKQKWKQGKFKPMDGGHNSKGEINKDSLK
tara:strand:+ start:323 stop:1051 length:729 start_codon:yes stop_codon:yes gene_type:complete